MATVLRGTLVTPHGPRGGAIAFGRTIERLDLDDSGGAGAPGRPLILPGFIDTHVHGGGGGDTMDGPEGVRTLAGFHLRHGTTTLLPTTITHPWPEVMRALRGVAEVRAEADPTLPDLPGAHLEGPFISPDRLGAQPPYAQTPTGAKLDELLALDVVRVATLAPEISGAVAAARRLAEAGVRVSVGHTDAGAATVAEVAAAVREVGGTLGFTHLYNAMSGLGSRAPGAVGSALADPESYAELILDTHHVHPTAFLAALRAKGERLHLITDAIRACGLSEGASELGGQQVTVAGGAARLADGTLAGSVLTLDRALRNALDAGVALERASRMLSATPARYLGLADRGTLEPGLRADLVVLSAALEVDAVYLAGARVVG